MVRGYPASLDCCANEWRPRGLGSFAHMYKVREELVDSSIPGRHRPWRAPPPPRHSNKHLIGGLADVQQPNRDRKKLVFT